MSSPEQISALMSALGPVLQPLTVEGSEQDATWGVLIEEDLHVIVDFDQKRNLIILECEVCALPAGEPSSHYEMMLNYNYLWAATGGTRLSISGPGGNVVQLRDIAADGLGPSDLADMIAGFGEEARAWREALTAPSNSPGTAGPFTENQGFQV